MARHRSDPQGAGRIAVMAAAMMTMLILVAVGGYALYGAVG